MVIFLQSYANHLAGQGCPACANENRRIPKEQAIENMTEKHNGRWTYPRFVYINNNRSFVTCYKHGDFLQSYSKQMSGQGCPKCVFSRDQPTQLYLMQSDCKTMIKIGISINPKARLKKLLTEQPFESKLIKTFEFKDFPSAFEFEQEIHKKLKDYKVGLNGFDGATEWFYVSTEEALLEIRKAS